MSGADHASRRVLGTLRSSQSPSLIRRRSLYLVPKNTVIPEHGGRRKALQTSSDGAIDEVRIIDFLAIVETRLLQQPRLGAGEKLSRLRTRYHVDTMYLTKEGSHWQHVIRACVVLTVLLRPHPSRWRPNGTEYTRPSKAPAGILQYVL